VPDRRYVRIVDDIRTRITSGQLAPGDPIPSARAITREWGVAVATASRALAVLRDQGLVDARPGVGTVVARRLRRTRGIRATSDGEIDVERIIGVAIDIADAEGLSAVSMRRLAIELGVATMALYRHVRGKNNLLQLMADSVLGQVHFPETKPPGWRSQLELVARLQWTGYRQHPWLARLVSMTRPAVVPNGMLHTEWALSAVAGIDLDPNTMLHMAVNLFAYVRGSATNVEMELESEQETGLTDDQWLESQGAHFARVLASGRYPQLARVIATPDVDLDVDTLFDFGLQRLLDGYAALIERPALRPSDRSRTLDRRRSTRAR
jgi:DNA-binding transcriptional regulator YhcF (GntR family)